MMSIYSEINAFIKAEKAARRAAKGTKEQRLAAHLQHRAECDERSKLLAPIAEAERKRKSEEVHEALYREKQTAEDVKQHYHTINPDVVPAIGYTNNPKKKSQKKALRKLLKGSKRNLTLSHLFTPEALTELSAASGGWSWTSSNTAVATVAKTGTDTATSSTATATGVAAGTATITATFNGTNDDGSLYAVSGTAQLTVTAAPASKATLTTASAEPISAIVGTTKQSYIVFDLDDEDDGSYIYNFNTVNGSGTGFGYLYVSTDGGATYKAASTGTNYTNKPMFAISGSSYGAAPTAAGSPSVKLTITDSYNNSIPVTVSVSITSNTLNTVTVTVSPSTGTHGVSGTWVATATCDAPDDGTYTYKWDFNGNPNGLTGTASGNKYTMTGTPTAATGTTPMQPHAAVTGHNTTKSGYGSLTIS